MGSLGGLKSLGQTRIQKPEKKKKKVAKKRNPMWMYRPRQLAASRAKYLDVWSLVRRAERGLPHERDLLRITACRHLPPPNVPFRFVIPPVRPLVVIRLAILHVQRCVDFGFRVLYFSWRRTRSRQTVPIHPQKRPRRDNFVHQVRVRIARHVNALPFEKRHRNGREGQETTGINTTVREQKCQVLSGKRARDVFNTRRFRAFHVAMFSTKGDVIRTREVLFDEVKMPCAKK